MRAAVALGWVGNDFVAPRSGCPSAEQFGKFKVLPLRAFLAAANRQFGVPCRDVRLVHREFLGSQELDDIDEGPSSADRRQLARVADEDDAVNTAQGVK